MKSFWLAIAEDNLREKKFAFLAEACLHQERFNPLLGEERVDQVVETIWVGGEPTQDLLGRLAIQIVGVWEDSPYGNQLRLVWEALQRDFQEAQEREDKLRADLYGPPDATLDECGTPGEIWAFPQFAPCLQGEWWKKTEVWQRHTSELEQEVLTYLTSMLRNEDIDL